MLKIVSVIGARPQFIKAVPVSKAIKEFNKKVKRPKSKIKEILVHTGQHYDYGMSDIFFRDLDLKKPDYNLNVGSHSQGKQTALMLERIEKILKREMPDLVLVYGDTNSTLAGALAAKKLNILTAHIEAGLRSYNMYMPEEINRIIVDRISDILFCPSKTSVKNLSLEGITNFASRKYPKVFYVGDVMYDAILFYFDIAKRQSDILKKLSLNPKGYYLATVHRAENTDNLGRLSSILESLNNVAKNEAPVIFPIHPRTEKAMVSLRNKALTKFIKIIKPISYLDMLLLQKNAKAVLTDSGGVQKEAYLLRVPCITLRGETEWVETVKSGCNILVDTDANKIAKALRRVSRSIVRPSQVYGDGNAGTRIVQILSLIFKDAKGNSLYSNS